jgi:hypothetical protein
MADYYECVRTDKLRLKGGSNRPKRKRNKFTTDDEAATAAKTEKTTEKKVALVSLDDGIEEEGDDVEPPTKVVRSYEDYLTPAEKKYRARLAQREKELIQKLAAQSHRERVEAFNVKLEKEPNHFDIPKVGPG